MNSAVELIDQLKRKFGEKKTDVSSFMRKTSDQMPFTALTSNQFAEGMKKIFELEPLIKLRSAQDIEALSKRADHLKAI